MANFVVARLRLKQKKLKTNKDPFDVRCRDLKRQKSVTSYSKKLQLQ